MNNPGFEIPLPEEHPAELSPEEFPAPIVPEVKNCTDLGNARWFVELHRAKVRYVADRQQWLVWDSKRWAPDLTGEIMRLAKKTAEHIYYEGCRAGGDEGDKLKKWAFKSEGEKALRAMIELAKTEKEIIVLGEDLDSDQYKLNVKNGTVDLRTGELLRPNPADLITRIVDVEYPAKQSGDCPAFKGFLGEIFNHDKELVEFVQKLFGYLLTGATNEQKFFYCYGTGANGKSTLLNTFADVLGPYAKQVPAEIFMSQERTGSGPSPELAQLPGVRLVQSNEVGEGRRMDEPLIKSLTGGDVIVARLLHKNPFEYRPQFKPLMAGNHKPEIRGMDLGIWRRVVLIPFTVTIQPDKRDKRLPEKLRAEYPEILRWAAQGCLKWQREGLTIPKAIQAATLEYKSDMDIVGTWINDCCLLGDHQEATAADIYKSYCEWADENGHRQMSKKKLAGSLKDRGFQQAKSGSSRLWRGIGLAADYSSASKDY